MRLVELLIAHKLLVVLDYLTANNTWILIIIGIVGSWTISITWTIGNTWTMVLLELWYYLNYGITWTIVLLEL